jgi:hypothetical protein
MATGTLIRHGSEAGYRAELQTDSVCAKCRKGHQMYDRYSRLARRGKRARPERNVAYDSEWTPARAVGSQSRSAPAVTPPGRPSPALTADPLPSADPDSPEPATGQQGPTLGDRLASRIRDLTIGNSPEIPEYVTDDDVGYVHEIDDVDQPGPEWEPVDDVDFVINAKALAAIQENLGTYLSIVGMTAEMIDPYCGGAIAANFDNMVQKWSKVIAHYPKAAQLFLDGTGGIIFTWIGALQATWPFLYAVYQHHLARTITIGPDGRVYRKGEQPNPSNNGQVPDPLQPQFQYSAT